MLDLYMIALFCLIALGVYIWKQREHLTLQEVDANTKSLDKKITTLEDDYKKLHNVVETQEKRMGSASSQAAGVKASMDSIRV
jgi:uncharacterized protein HemX